MRLQNDVRTHLIQLSLAEPWALFLFLLFGWILGQPFGALAPLFGALLRPTEQTVFVREARSNSNRSLALLLYLEEVIESLILLEHLFVMVFVARQI